MDRDNLYMWVIFGSKVHYNLLKTLFGRNSLPFELPLLHLPLRIPGLLSAFSEKKHLYLVLQFVIPQIPAEYYLVTATALHKWSLLGCAGDI